MNTFLGSRFFRFGFVDMFTIGIPSWLLMPGSSVSGYICVGLDTKNKASILSFLVDSLTSWYCENSSAMSMICLDMVDFL